MTEYKITAEVMKVARNKILERPHIKSLKECLCVLYESYHPLIEKIQKREGLTAEDLKAKLIDLSASCVLIACEMDKFIKDDAIQVKEREKKPVSEKRV